jgi:RNA polymerase sigma factor (sigma-70 family)
MAAHPETLLWYIHRLVIPSEAGEATDAALLGRFIAERDERAFAALVDRHGALVLQVCQRVLGDTHDAEDAFQAVFLVLARKAAQVRPREALTAWLHGVARRVALKARSARGRHSRKARPLAASPTDPHSDPLADISGRELLMIIDEELQRLAEVYRLPVILCCLEGRSLEEAARQLGWTRGSVKGRLERGRERLHNRLLRRGLTLSAALAAAGVSRPAVSAAVVGRLVAPTVCGAMAFAADATTAPGGISPEAAALAGQTLRSMARAKLMVAAALLLPMCVLAAGFASHRAAQPPATAPPSRPSPIPPKDKAPLATPVGLVNNQPATSPDEADAPIEVSGRVLDPASNPFAGARLYVGYSVRRYALRSAPDNQGRQTDCPLRATSGGDGRFHIAFARSELDPRWLDDWKPAVVAVADGHGPDWAEIPAAAWSRNRAPTEGAELSLKLVADLPVNGRIVDQDHKPVAGAKVLVRDVICDSEEGVTRFLRGDGNSWSPRSWKGPLPQQPLDVTTDADDRFSLTGLGRDRIVRLALEGPTIQHAVFMAATRPSPVAPEGGGSLAPPSITRPAPIGLSAVWCATKPPANRWRASR